MHHRLRSLGVASFECVNWIGEFVDKPICNICTLVLLPIHCMHVSKFV